MNIDADVGAFAAWINAAVAEGRFEVVPSADCALLKKSVEHPLGLFTLRGFPGRSGVGPSFAVERR